MADETKPEVKPKNLVQKLAEIMAAVSRISKSGYNESRKYHYATEADTAEALRGEFSKRNIFVFPNVISANRVPHGTSRAGTPMFLTDVMVEWEFVDGDSGESKTCTMPGCGQDDQDKGIYKAITGSEKYLLMKAFLIPTGDDPEADSKEERKDAKEQGKEAAQAVAQRKLAEHAANKPAQVDMVKASVESAKNDGLFEEVSGTIMAVREMSTSKEKGSKPYRRVAMSVASDPDFAGVPYYNDIELVAWDNFVLSDGKLFDFLRSGLTDVAGVFLCEIGDYKGKPNYTVKDVKRIGNHTWDARLGDANRS